MTPRWMEIAEAEIGQHEITGDQANPRIVEYHAATWLHATSDEVAWCSSFVNWCLIKAEINPTRSAAARSWLNWGEQAEPKPGAITVIRKKGSSGTAGYHVGFFISQDPLHVTLLGGNQSNAVKRSAFPLSGYNVVGYRWPTE